MTTRVIPAAVSVFICLIVGACGGKKESVAEVPVEDITRPPQTVLGGAKKVQEETNPDETISYDEWRRRREQEAEGDTP